MQFASRWSATKVINSYKIVGKKGRTEKDISKLLGFFLAY
jgi:hypothetical protein